MYLHRVTRTWVGPTDHRNISHNFIEHLETRQSKMEVRISNVPPPSETCMLTLYSVDEHTLQEHPPCHRCVTSQLLTHAVSCSADLKLRLFVALQARGGKHWISELCGTQRATRATAAVNVGTCPSLCRTADPFNHRQLCPTQKVHQSRSSRCSRSLQAVVSSSRRSAAVQPPCEAAALLWEQ